MRYRAGFGVKLIGYMTVVTMFATCRHSWACLPAVTPGRWASLNCAPLTGSVRMAHRRTASTACAGELFPRLNAQNAPHPRFGSGA